MNGTKQTQPKGLKFSGVKLAQANKLVKPPAASAARIGAGCARAASMNARVDGCDVFAAGVFGRRDFDCGNVMISGDMREFPSLEVQFFQRSIPFDDGPQTPFGRE